LDIRSTYPKEPIVEQGAIFKSNRSQAVRLPKSVALPDDVKRVDVVAIGRIRILTPAGESWDSWFDGEGVSPDFMSTRDQPADQEREGF
jgi:antitoxin VapB